MAKGGFGTFVLGAVVGSVLTVGAAVGTGFWAYKNLSIEKVEQIIKQDFGVDDTLSKLTIESLVSLGTDVASNPGSYTVEDLANKFSLSLPYTFSINGKDINLSLFLDHIYKCKLDNLSGKGFNDLKNSLTLGNIKNVFGEALELPNMKLFDSYKNTSVLNLGGIMSTLKVGDCLTVRYDAQGNEIEQTGVMGMLADMKVQDLMKDDAIQNFVYDLTLGDIYEYDGTETGIVAALKDLRISELSSNNKLLDAIGTNTIGDIMKLNAISGFGVIIKDWKINDIRTQEALQAKIDEVKLGDVISIGNSGFLAQIKTWSLSDITEANIMNLNVGDVLQINETSGILSKIKTLKLSDLQNSETVNEKIKSLTIGEILPSSTVYEEGTILYAVKNTQVGNISDRLQTLKVSEIIPAGEGGYSDVMSYLIDPANGKDPLVTELPEKLESAIDEYVEDMLETMTIGELIDAGLIEDNGYSDTVKEQIAIEVIQQALDSTN